MVEPESHAVEAVRPDEELLAGTPAELRARAVLRLLAQPLFGARDEVGALSQHCVAQAVVGHELIEAKGRVALPVDCLERAALHVVEARRVGLVQPAAAPVGKQVVVQGVRGNDSPVLDGFGHRLGAPWNARGETCSLSVHRGPTVPRDSLGSRR